MAPHGMKKLRKARRTKTVTKGKSLKTPIIKMAQHKGIKARGASRIDVILANFAAASSICELRYRWDLIEEAHVPLEITVNIDQLNADQVAQKTAGNVMSNISPEEIADKAEQIFDNIYETYGATLEKQVAAQKLDEAHMTWNVMAEIFVHIAHGED